MFKKLKKFGLIVLAIFFRIKLLTVPELYTAILAGGLSVSGLRRLMPVSQVEIFTDYHIMVKLAAKSMNLFGAGILLEEDRAEIERLLLVHPEFSIWIGNGTPDILIANKKGRLHSAFEKIDSMITGGWEKGISQASNNSLVR